MDDSEAIKNFCPFEKGGAWSPQQDQALPQDPMNDHQLYNILLSIKQSPCKKQQCVDRLIKLVRMDKHRQLISAFTKDLANTVYQ